MSPEKKHLHESSREEEIQIDLTILRFLREEILIGNLEHVCMREYYGQGVFSSDTDCSWERFRRRALYQVGLGLVDPLVVPSTEGEQRGRRADEKKDCGHLYALRITPLGFVRIDELEKELQRYEGFNRYVVKIQEFNEKILGMK